MTEYLPHALAVLGVSFILFAWLREEIIDLLGPFLFVVAILYWMWLYVRGGKS